MPLLTIARLTLREAARRRLLHAVAILTLLLILLTGWGISKLETMGHPPSKTELLITMATLVLLIAYMFSMVLAVGAAFIAAPAIASDVESGIVLALLPRPIRRSDVVIGKWLGLAVLLAGYTTVACTLELLMVRLIGGYIAPRPVEAILFLIGEALVMMTLALLLSTRLSPMTGGIIAIVLFGVAWIGGIVGSIATVLNNTTLVHTGTVISLLLPTDGLWRGAAYNLEPAVLIAGLISGGRESANPFSTTAPPTTPYIVWALGWIVVVAGLASLRFNRRDL